MLFLVPSYSCLVCCVLLQQFTYGYARADVFGAVTSIFFLWAITLWLVYEAYNRTVLWVAGDADPVNGSFVFAVMNRAIQSI